MAGERYVDVIYGHDDAIHSLGYSPDGTLLISGGNDAKVRFWHLQKHRCVEEVEFRSAVGCVAFSPDGKAWAAMDREGNVAVHGVDGSKISTKMSPCSGFRWLPDSKTILGTNSNGRVYLYNIYTQNPLYIQRHNDHDVYALAVSPDSRYVASAGSDYIIRVWDTAEGRELPVLEYHKNAVSALAFSPDSKTLGSGDKGTMLAYWNVKVSGNKALQQSFQWSGHEIADVCFCPTHAIFATTGADNRVKFFDIENGNRRLEDLTGHNRHIFSIAFSPDGKFLASGGGDHKIIVWNVKRPNFVS